MNISNVLQTEIVEVLMETMNETYLTDNIKLKEYTNEEELLKDYKNRCRLVRRGGNTDIQKALKEGKPLIIEGFAVDPNLYVGKIDSEMDSKSDELKSMGRLELLKEHLSRKSDFRITFNNLDSINSSNHTTDKLKIVTPEPKCGEEFFKVNFIKHKPYFPCLGER